MSSRQTVYESPFFHRAHMSERTEAEGENPHGRENTEKGVACHFHTSCTDLSQNEFANNS